MPCTTDPATTRRQATGPGIQQASVRFLRSCKTKKVVDKNPRLCYHLNHDEAPNTTTTPEDLGALPGRPGTQGRQPSEPLAIVFPPADLGLPLSGHGKALTKTHL
jgi:hypothetical protein